MVVNDFFTKRLLLKMKIQTLILLLTLSQISFGQIGNDQHLIVKNDVKSSYEKYCFLNSNSSCTVIYEEYDQNGNSVEWDMARLGTIYRNVYDEKNNKVMTLWVDKLDTSRIDIFQYKYDHHNELVLQVISNDTTEFENIYDKNGRLIKIVTQSKNVEGNIVKKTTSRIWTTFNKIQTETTRTEIFEIAKKTEYDKRSGSKIDFKYDQNKNLIKAIYYHADTISKTFSYKYDSDNRLIEEIEDNPIRAGRINRMVFGKRDEIKRFKTTTRYNNLGQIAELYTYFSDPCMSLDNHFLYRHFYKDNGLLDYADVYENDQLIFTIKYEYEYYK